MANSFVQVTPDGGGKRIDSQVLDNGNYRQTVTIGDPAYNAQVANVTTTGALNVQAADAIQLYSNSVSIIGNGSQIDTTGYQSISLQVTGAFSGYMRIEGSNDGTNWSYLMLFNLQEFELVDKISSMGNYGFKTSTRYMRYNVLEIIGTATMVIVGRSGDGPNAADAVAMAMSGEQNMPLNVNLTSGLFLDKNKAIVLSDGIQYFCTVQNSAGAYPAVVIDCTGYQTAILQSSSATGSTLYQSLDGFNWLNPGGPNSTTVYGNNSGSLVQNAGPLIALVWGRYIRINSGNTNVGSITYTIILKFGNLLAGMSSNITGINGNATGAGGVAGALPIIGCVAEGNIINNTFWPVQMAAKDTAGTIRRILSDTSGKLLIAGTDPTNTARAIGVLSPQASPQNVAAQPTADQSMYEGQSMIELFAQILTELRIMNQQMSITDSIKYWSPESS